MIVRNNVPVIDLFAGVGGLGLGASASGGDVRLSVEIDHTCCETMRKNLKGDTHKILEEDVSSLTGVRLRYEAGLSNDDPLLIVGGAPCQPFSKAAYWTDPGNEARHREARADGTNSVSPGPILVPKQDQRRTLIEEFWRLVVEANADAFVFENVPSILHPRNLSTFQSLRDAFEDVGYKTTLVKANAAQYGVAQARERIFLLGLKKEAPSYSKCTHAWKIDNDPSLIPTVTSGEALKPFASKKFMEPEEIVSGKWAEQLFEIPPGWNYKALTEWAGHPNPSFIAERRFWNFLLKLSPDKPSWTIAASPGPWTGPFHWKNRRLRTTEMAALQSFPIGYRFTGSRRDRVRQIGNAVPPLLAQKMTEMLLDKIGGIGQNPPHKLQERVYA